jgi:hypothetical protein
MKFKPGSEEFNASLLKRMQEDERLGSLSNLCINRVEETSRNTVICRVSGGGQKFVAKVQMTKPPSVVEGEFHSLQKLEMCKSVAGLRFLCPVAFYPELGVLITREESGISLRTIIDRGIASREFSADRKLAEDLVSQAAFGLYAFHTLFNIQTGRNGSMQARRYLDYSPKNILVTQEQYSREIVLLDPPEYQEEGSVYLDLGTFCFDVARAAFMPAAILRVPHCWLDRLKWLFLKSYFSCHERPLSDYDLHRVRLGEEARVRQTLMWYAGFLKYRKWPVEMLRFLYFSPMVLLYKHVQIRRSFGRLKKFLHDPDLSE